MMAAPLKDKSYQQTSLGASVADKRIARRSERTLDSYERDIARLCVMYAHRSFDDLTLGDCVEYLNTYPRPSQKRARSSIAGFLDWAYIDGRLTNDLKRKLPPIREQTQQHIETFDADEVENLKNLPLELRDRALTTLLLDTGIRRDEALRLQLRDIDLDRRRLLVRRGKGGKSRTIPFREEVATIIADLTLMEALEPNDHLWYIRRVNPNWGERIRRDKKPTEGVWHRWWVRMCEEAGVLYRKPHTARHTYATDLLRRGVSMHAVCKLCGHASIRTTIDLYAHLVVDDLAAELERAFAQEALEE